MWSRTKSPLGGVNPTRSPYRIPCLDRTTYGAFNKVINLVHFFAPEFLGQIF